MMSEKTELHNMHIGCIKLVTQFQLHLVTDIATTRPRNSTLGKFLLIGCFPEPNPWISLGRVNFISLSMPWMTSAHLLPEDFNP